MSAEDWDSVAFYLSNLDVGGAQRVVVNLANEFAARGADVDVVLVTEQGPLADELEPAVTLVELECERALTAIPSVVQYLRRRSPDAFVSSMTYLNVTAVFAAAVAGVDAAVGVVEHNTRPAPRPTEPPVALARLLYPRADFVVAVSDGVADDVADWAGVDREAVDVVYNPVVTDSLRDAAREPPAHDWLVEDVPVVFGTGRHVEQKDFETFLRAFAAVERRREVRCILAGEGPLTDEYVALCRELGVEDVVDTPGFVQNLYSYMRHADVFVLSSRWEGFGNVLVEAMACGTPVVSTDCPSGPAEILADGEYGALVDVGDHAAMADAIERALDDPPPAARLRDRAADFRVEAVAASYETLLQR